MSFPEIAASPLERSAGVLRRRCQRSASTKQLLLPELIRFYWEKPEWIRPFQLPGGGPEAGAGAG